MNNTIKEKYEGFFAYFVDYMLTDELWVGNISEGMTWVESGKGLTHNIILDIIKFCDGQIIIPEDLKTFLGENGITIKMKYDESDENLVEGKDTICVTITKPVNL